MMAAHSLRRDLRAAAALGVAMGLMAGCAPSGVDGAAPRPPSAPAGPAAAAGATAPAGAMAPGDISVDPGRPGQTMTGLGVNANVHSWKNGQLKPAIERYAALGPLTWRVIIEKADWEPAQVGDPNTIDAAYDRRIYESPKMQDLWDTIAYIESFPGQTVSLSVMGGVPDWMGGTSIPASKEAYWVRMIASLLDYGRTEKHLTLNLISPLNESDWNGIEGPKADPQQLTRLLDSLGHRLDALGMGDVRFVVPDTSSPDEARTAYLPAILSDSFVVDKTARIGIHSYDGSAGSVPDFVAQGRAAAKGVWATEFNAPCSGCDTGTQPSDTWDHAQSMASDLLALIGQGVTGAQLYDAWDGYYEHHGSMGYWGALKYDAARGTYVPRRTFDVLSLLLTAIPPGSVHIASTQAETGGEAMDVQAFASADGRMTVVGVNHGGTAAHVRVLVSGAAGLSAPTLTVASPDSGGVVQAVPPQIDGNALALTVPAGAVFAATAAF